MRRKALLPVVLLICIATCARPAFAQRDDVATLQQQVAQLVKAGRHNEALAIGQRYLEAAQARYGEQDVEYARATSWLGHVYMSLNRYAEAEPLYARTVAILEKRLGSNDPNVGATLNDLAGLYRELGRFEESHALYERVLAIGERTFGAQHQNVGAVLNNIAQLYESEGRYREAETYFKRALAIGEKALGSDNLDFANGMISLGALYREQGRYAEAEALYQQVLVIREKKLGLRHPDVGKILNALALLYATQQQFAEAEPLYKRALSIFEEVQGPDHPNVGLVLNNLGELNREQARYEEAERLYKRALAIEERTAGSEHLNVATDLNNLALLYRNQHRYADAEPLYKRALAIKEKALGPEHREVGRGLNNLAGVYAADGRFADAEPLYKRALAIEEQVLGPDHTSVGLTLASMAVLYAEWGDIAQAIAYQRRATALRIKLGELALGNDDRSKREVLQGSHYFRFHVLLASRASDDPAALLSESFMVSQWALQSEASDAVAQMSVRFASAGGGLGNVVRERQDILNQHQTIEGRLLTATAKADKVGADGARKSIVMLEAQLRTLDRRIAQEFPQYVQLARPKPLDVTDVRSLLNDDEALVAFLEADHTGKLPQEVYAWIVTKTDARWLRLPMNPAEISAHVASLRCGLDAAAWEANDGSKCASLLKTSYQATDMQAGRPLPFDLHKAYALYRALLGPVEDIIANKHLLIVPSGSLTALPFQVLVTTKPSDLAPGNAGFATAAWLIKRQAITVLPSVASLAALRKFAKTSAATQPFIGFGNPLLHGRNRNDRSAWERQSCNLPSKSVRTVSRGVRSPIPQFFRRGLGNVELVRAQPPLPETADELCAVAAAIGAGEDAVYLGARFNEETVKSLSANGTLRRARIVHFATHGLLGGETQMMGAAKAEPSLILTPPLQATEVNDGLLTASEIAQLRLDADWVVLSACNTAAGASDKPGAEALSGLARAFFYAGARALLVSHWAVNSEATVRLITKAFSELKSDAKLGRAEALRRSMVALIERGGGYDHPANWAPFVVVGEGAR
jgi:CHAT domain-containing protein/tetratricopeptide (TPR) repeat protein